MGLYSTPTPVDPETHTCLRALGKSHRSSREFKNIKQHPFEDSNQKFGSDQPPEKHVPDLDHKIPLIVKFSVFFAAFGCQDRRKRDCAYYAISTGS